MEVVEQQTFEQSNEIPTAAPTTIDFNVPIILQQNVEHQQQDQLLTLEQLGPQEEEEEEELEDGEETLPKLVVPKFKLRVPKEFQKSVDAVISTSEESENESISTASEEEELEEVQQISQTTANTQTDFDISKITHSTTENKENMSIDSSEFDNGESIKLFKEEWEQRLKESVNDMKAMENKLAEETAATINGIQNSQWTPTPPASPKSATANSAASLQEQNTLTNEDTTTEIQSNITLTNTTTTTTSNNTTTAENEQDEKSSSLNEPQEVANPELVQEPQTVAVAVAAAETVAVADEHIEEKIKDAVKSPKIDIEAASEEDALPIHIKMERALDSYDNAVDFIRYCLNYSYPICLYCNHARRIAVNAHSLVQHMLENHRYTPAVNGITIAEDVKATSLMDKLKAIQPELQNIYINGNNFNSAAENQVENERIYECFMCRFATKTHKELYLHNRKMHLRSAVLCFMCRSHFVSFSEVLCHICPGAPHKQQEIDLQYRCCLCNLQNIPSSFRLMVHLRKKHNSCDVCLEDCVDQNRLSSHVWKHKFRHYCYRCNIGYRNKNDITNHLFWKHGTESTICKRCLAKRWRHVYHFCMPSSSFVCETCNECFSKAIYLKVHQRLHEEEQMKYACETEGCEVKFISRRLLLKHKQQIHKLAIEPPAEPDNTVDKALEVEPVENSAEKTEEQAEKENKDEIDAKNETIVASEVKPAENDEKEDESKNQSKQILTFEALNLSESSDSSDSENEDLDAIKKNSLPDSFKRTFSPVITNTTEEENKENKNLVTNENENEVEKEENSENVLDIWKNFLNAQKNTDDNLNFMEAEEITKDIEDNKPARLHVAYSDHDYCLLLNPNDNKKKDKHRDDKESNSATPTKEQIKLSLSDNDNNAADTSSDSDSSDGSGCSCGSNCSCGSSSSNSDSDSSNSNSSDSDSSDDSNKSQKKSLNRSKDSNRSPHKKHHRHDSVRTENHAEDHDNNEEVAMEIEPPRAPQICESDLETSDTDSDEEFYAQHPQKEAQEVLIKERALLLAQTPINNHVNDDLHTNGGGTVDGDGGVVADTLDNEHDDKKERKKLKKKKRDKRQQLNNNNNNNNINVVRQLQFEPQNVTLNNILQHGQHNQLYNSFSNTPVEPVLNMDAYNAHMPYAAEQTVITGARSIISEGGGSSSEADGSLKRSKRMRRPNKFYGYTSDDETMSAQQSLMIGSRAFKPQPPPVLTWNKDDLPTPSKSILNQNKTPKSIQRPVKAAPTENLDEAFGEFAQLINQDNRKRAFGIAAGGKIGAEGAFYKHAAKKNRVKARQVSSTEEEGGYNLPPIPRLKIKPSQIGLKLKSLKEIQTSSSSSASSSEDELDMQQLTRPEVNSQAAKTLNVKPHLQLNALATPTAVLQAQQQQQQQQSQQQQQVLPAAISTPIPKTTAFNHSIPPALLPNPDFNTLQYFKANNIRYPIRPPAGARQPREGESVYCYCRCPYDEVSEMIACDGNNCVIEWFHFECVGIMMAPQGKWYCAECRPKYITNSLTNLIKPPF